ncbi:hypothetical protein LTR08_006190 [Meristemomyces frigidus]|nr:hypothetical protein LTR08_006190 [Meristemomyces frigidus]
MASAAPTRALASPPIDTRDRSTSINEDESKITGVEVVASYNWVDSENAVMLVPGVPPTWSPPSETPQLEPDQGWRWIDQNAHRSPKAPIEPLIRAVLRQHPDYDFTNTNLISDRQPLSCLLKFAAGDSKAFSFSVQVVGNIVIFTRKGSKTREFVGPETYAGFRKDFEKKYTKYPAAFQSSTSHHRILSYKLGALRILLRCGADACLAPQAPLTTNSGVGKPPTEPLQETSDNITVQGGGSEVPQSDIVELATRVDKRGFPDYAITKFPELWLAQTPNFITALSSATVSSKQAVYCRSVFTPDNISIRKSADDVAQWEKNNTELISKFLKVLAATLETARDEPAKGDRLLVVSREEGDNEIHIIPDTGAVKLPEDLSKHLMAKQ